MKCHILNSYNRYQSSLSLSLSLSTCCLSGLEVPQLLDGRGEGVGDDRGEDEDGEEQDEDGGHDESDVLARHGPLAMLLYPVLETSHIINLLHQLYEHKQENLNWTSFCNYLRLDYWRGLLNRNLKRKKYYKLF